MSIRGWTNGIAPSARDEGTRTPTKVRNPPHTHTPTHPAHLFYLKRSRDLALVIVRLPARTVILFTVYGVCTVLLNGGPRAWPGAGRGR